MTDFPESKLDWLIENFKQHQDWINAEDIRKKIHRTYRKAEDCRKLMNLAVEKGHAVSSDSYPSATKKNSISFNPPCIAPTFDTCLMTDPRFGYMPRNLFKTMGWCLDSPEFFSLENEWRLVYSLLCSVQYHGLPDYGLLAETQVLAETQIFVFPNPPKLIKLLVLSAKRIASYYLLIKLAYMECYEKKLLPHSDPRPDGYIDLFLCFLWDDYERRYILLKNKPSYKIQSRTRLNLSETFLGGELDMDKKRHQNVMKFFGRQDADFDVPIGSKLIIEEMVNSCDSEGVKEAISRLDGVNKEYKKSVLKELRFLAKKTG